MTSTSTSPERLGPLRKRRKKVIEDNDDEDEDEGPAPSSGELLFASQSFGELRLGVSVLSDLRSTIAELQPRSFYVFSAT